MGFFKLNFSSDAGGGFASPEKQDGTLDGKFSSTEEASEISQEAKEDYLRKVDEIIRRMDEEYESRGDPDRDDDSIIEDLTVMEDDGFRGALSGDDKFLKAITEWTIKCLGDDRDNSHRLMEITELGTCFKDLAGLSDVASAIYNDQKVQEAASLAVVNHLLSYGANKELYNFLDNVDRYLGREKTIDFLGSDSMVSAIKRAACFNGEEEHNVRISKKDPSYTVAIAGLVKAYEVDKSDPELIGLILQSLPSQIKRIWQPESLEEQPKSLEETVKDLSSLINNMKKAHIDELIPVVLGNDELMDMLSTKVIDDIRELRSVENTKNLRGVLSKEGVEEDKIERIMKMAVKKYLSNYVLKDLRTNGAESVGAFIDELRSLGGAAAQQVDAFKENIQKLADVLNS